LRGRLLNLLTAVSVFLCLASAGLWVRSYYRSDLGQYVARDGWALSVMLGNGAADFISSAELPGVTTDWTTEAAREGATGWWWFRSDFTDYPAWMVRIPLWFPLALAAVLPTMRCRRHALRRLHGRRMTRGGRCVQCGYDLAGNVSGVCPEYGRERPAR